MATPSSQTSTDNRWQSRFDGLFLAVLGAGAAAIVFLHGLYGPRLAAELVPVGLMVVYGAVQQSSGTYKGHEDRLGDNVYYLGFLFTLISLLVSLLMLRPNDSSVSSILVYSFGVALTTTIVGLLGRVILYQLYGEPPEDPVISMQRLGESARQASQELNRVVERVRYTYVEGSQSTKEFFAEASATARQAVQEIRRSYTDTSQSIRESFAEAAIAARQMLDDTAGSMKAAAAETTGALRQSATALHKRIDTIGSRVDAVAAALEQMAQRVREIEIPADLIKARLNPLADVVAQALDKVAQAAQAAKNSNDRLDASLSQIESDVGRINNAMLKLAEIVNQLGGLVLLLEQIRKEMALLAAELKNAARSI